MRSIVSVDRDWGIGRDGGLLFRIPDDMRRFREATLGRTVVMGRGTFESIPGPLPGRRNVVLSGTMQPRPGVEVARSPEELFDMVDGDDVWVIGGQSVYGLLLPYCDEALVTMVDSEGSPDRFHPDLDADPGWVLRDESSVMFHGDLRFTYRTYVRTPRPDTL